MTSIGAEINAMQGEIDTSIQTHMGKLMDLINAEEDGEKKPKTEKKIIKKKKITC